MSMKIIQSVLVPVGIDNLIGQRFGYLVVESFNRKNKWGNPMWNCRCDGGELKVICAGDLKSGRITSCGDAKNCKYAFAIKSNAHSIHGLTNTNTKEYQCWHDMNRRCYEVKNIYYFNYGGRGITVFNSWITDFQAFYNYLLTLPETWQQFEARTGEKATLDRIDKNGNYEPGNIRWASMQEQNQNTRQNVFTETMVKIALWERKVHNKSGDEIKLYLETNCGYTGSRTAVYNVIRGIKWTNINIDKEIAEYKQFGTVNGISYNE